VEEAVERRMRRLERLARKLDLAQHWWSSQLGRGVAGGGPEW
jgi:hypothetical protein